MATEVNQLPPPPPGFSEAPPTQLPPPPAGFSEVPGAAPGPMPTVAGPRMPMELRSDNPLPVSLSPMESVMAAMRLLTGGAMPGGGLAATPPGQQSFANRMKVAGAGEFAGLGVNSALGAIANRMRQAQMLRTQPVLDLAGGSPRVIPPTSVLPEQAAQLTKEAEALQSPLAQLKDTLGKLQMGKEKLPGLEQQRQVQIQQIQQQIAQITTRQKALAGLATKVEQPISSSNAGAVASAAAPTVKRALPVAAKVAGYGTLYALLEKLGLLPSFHAK